MKSDFVEPPNYKLALRDHFAGQALEGMLASTDDTGAAGLLKKAEELKRTPQDFLASAAYGFADAMLKAREKCLTE